jgi:hypothetical protein
MTIPFRHELESAERTVENIEEVRAAQADAERAEDLRRAQQVLQYGAPLKPPPVPEREFVDVASENVAIGVPAGAAIGGTIGGVTTGGPGMFPGAVIGATGGAIGGVIDAGMYKAARKLGYTEEEANNWVSGLALLYGGLSGSARGFVTKTPRAGQKLIRSGLADVGTGTAESARAQVQGGWRAVKQQTDELYVAARELMDPNVRIPANRLSSKLRPAERSARWQKGDGTFTSTKKVHALADAQGNIGLDDLDGIRSSLLEEARDASAKGQGNRYRTALQQIEVIDDLEAELAISHGGEAYEALQRARASRRLQGELEHGFEGQRDTSVFRNLVNPATRADEAKKGFDKVFSTGRPAEALRQMRAAVRAEGGDQGAALFDKTMRRQAMQHLFRTTGDAPMKGAAAVLRELDDNAGVYRSILGENGYDFLRRELVAEAAGKKGLLKAYETARNTTGAAALMGTSAVLGGGHGLATVGGTVAVMVGIKRVFGEAAAREMFLRAAADPRLYKQLMAEVDAGAVSHIARGVLSSAVRRGAVTSTDLFEGHTMESYKERAIETGQALGIGEE